MLAGTEQRLLLQRAAPMSDPLEPSVALLAKLGSIVQHADEALSDDGHAFDWTALRGLLADPDVTEWIGAMQKLAFVPVKRKAR